jgi:phosphoribosyl-ATP pyrophosphohydrolase
VTDVAAYLSEYLSARGLDMPSGASARKVAEEAVELVEVCAVANADPQVVAHELADVVLAAAVVARHYGFTVEDAMRAKIDLDRGRERRVVREARAAVASGQQPAGPQPE